MSSPCITITPYQTTSNLGETPDNDRRLFCNACGDKFCDDTGNINLKIVTEAKDAPKRESPNSISSTDRYHQKADVSPQLLRERKYKYAQEARQLHLELDAALEFGMGRKDELYVIDLIRMIKSYLKEVNMVAWEQSSGLFDLYRADHHEKAEALKKKHSDGNGKVANPNGAGPTAGRMVFEVCGMHRRNLSRGACTCSKMAAVKPSPQSHQLSTLPQKSCPSTEGHTVPSGPQPGHMPSPVSIYSPSTSTSSGLSVPQKKRTFVNLTDEASSSSEPPPKRACTTASQPSADTTKRALHATGYVDPPLPPFLGSELQGTSAPGTGNALGIEIPPSPVSMLALTPPDMATPLTTYDPCDLLLQQEIPLSVETTDGKLVPVNNAIFQADGKVRRITDGKIITFDEFTEIFDGRRKLMGLAISKKQW